MSEQLFQYPSHCHSTQRHPKRWECGHVFFQISSATKSTTDIWDITTDMGPQKKHNWYGTTTREMGRVPSSWAFWGLPLHSLVLHNSCWSTEYLNACAAPGAFPNVALTWEYRGTKGRYLHLISAGSCEGCVRQCLAGWFWGTWLRSGGCPREGRRGWSLGSARNEW